MNTVSIVGPGRLGGALAIALSRAGIRVERLIYRATEPADTLVQEIQPTPQLIDIGSVSRIDSELVLITTPDTEIASAAEMIAPRLAKGSVLMHTSGALSSRELEPAAIRGIRVASMHPLVSVSDPVAGAGHFSGAFFCIEGPAAAEAEIVVKSLGGTPFSIETRFKPLYHASAVLASGHVVALFAAAVETLSRCGLDTEKAAEVLSPLIRSSVANLESGSVAAALTGPFARTDVEAVRRHITAFASVGLEDERRIYLELGIKALELAEASDADRRSIADIRDLIKLAQEPA